MPLRTFSASPGSVKQNELLQLEAKGDTDVKDTDFVIYEIVDSVNVKFHDGSKRLRGAFANKRNTTTTSLSGDAGVVEIFAYVEGQAFKRRRSIFLQ